MQTMTGSSQVSARAVVFGASGGIGRALVAELAGEGRDVLALSRSGEMIEGARRAAAFDLRDEGSIAAAASDLASDPPGIVIVATGALTLADGTAPEKSYRHLDADAMMEAYRINAIGPALIAKHVLPIMPRGRRHVFAALAARVGSIGDNRLGGWHSYRASKAALAMLIRNLAIEHARTHGQGVVVGLHPGTVATALSAPFRQRLAEGQLMAPDRAARAISTVLSRLDAHDSGNVFDWRGEVIAP